MTNPNCHFVPLYTTRVVAYTLATVAGAISVASCFHAKHQSSLTKGDAQAAVQKLTPGVKLTIDTSDVVLAGTIQGIAQLGLALLGFFSLILLVMDTRKRFAVVNASHVRKTIWSSKTLILQIPSWVIATCFTLATSIVTTVFVAHREAKVISVLPNGKIMAPSLVQAFQGKLGISPVYKNQEYLVFMAASPWPAVFFSFVSLIVTVVAWRRHSRNPQSDSSSSFESTEKM